MYTSLPGIIRQQTAHSLAEDFDLKWHKLAIGVVAIFLPSYSIESDACILIKSMVVEISSNLSFNGLGSFWSLFVICNAQFARFVEFQWIVLNFLNFM